LGIRFAEDWKKEYEKILLSRKYSRACSVIGMASTNPTIENVKQCYGFVLDFITNLPIPLNSEKSGKIRKNLLNRLDEISLILYGKNSEKKKELMKKYNVSEIRVRRGIKRVASLGNIPNLIKELRDILIEAGGFAVSSGLRITLATPQPRGIDKILKEEGFKEEQEEDYEY